MRGVGFGKSGEDDAGNGRNQKRAALHRSRPFVAGPSPVLEPQSSQREAPIKKGCANPSPAEPPFWARRVMIQYYAVVGGSRLLLPSRSLPRRRATRICLGSEVGAGGRLRDDVGNNEQEESSALSAGWRRTWSPMSRAFFNASSEPTKSRLSSTRGEGSCVNRCAFCSASHGYE